MKKFATDVRRGDRVLVGGEKHVATADALSTYGGVTVVSVPDSDRSADDTQTKLDHNDDIELW
jgi:hypothetical protein